MTPSRILTWTVTPAGLLAVATLVACKPATPRSEPLEPTAAAKVTPSPLSVPAIVCLGTSLTAGLGLDPDLAYPSRIQEKVDAAGLRYRVVNAGVSGETSAGALRRVDWILREPVAVLIVETGANDALRGQDPQATKANIQALFDRARQQSPRPKLVLVGMLAPPNYGADYGRRFQALYPELAKQNEAALIPFLLEGVAGRAVLNQGDGIHPTAEGQQIMAENVWKVLRPLL